MARQRVALHTVILEHDEKTGNDGFWDGGIAGRAVHQWSLGFQRQPEGDVGGFRTNRAEHCPNFVVINHPDSIVGGSAPDGGILGHAGTGKVTHLPVVIVVVRDNSIRLAAVTSGGIGLVNRHLRAVQHAIAEHLFRMVVEWSEESDANLIKGAEVGVGDVAGRAVVFDEILIVLIVRSRELGKRTQVFRGAGVGLQRTSRRPARRILAVRTRSGGLSPRRTREQNGDHHRSKQSTHSITPWVLRAGTWQSLRFRSADRAGREWPECPWKPAAGRVAARYRKRCALH